MRRKLYGIFDARGDLIPESVRASAEAAWLAAESRDATTGWMRRWHSRSEMEREGCTVGEVRICRD